MEWCLPSLSGQREALERITQREERLHRLLSNGAWLPSQYQAPKANGCERTVSLPRLRFRHG